MRITRLERDQRGFVLDLDPLMMLDRLEFPNAFALLAIESDAQTKDDLPAGLLIASVQAELLVIDWLYVAAAHRMQGIGEQLLVAAFEYAAQKGIVRLGAYINDEYGRSDICAGQEHFFRERLFREKQPLGGEWLTDLQTLAMQPGLRTKAQTTAQTGTFRNLSVTQAGDVIAQLLRMEQCDTLYPMRAQERYFDPDASVVLSDQGKLCGGLLIQCVVRDTPRIKGGMIVRSRENILYPVLCCAPSDADARVLAAEALKAAALKYGTDTQVHVILKSDRYAGVMDDAWNRMRVNNRLLTARVEDYRSAKERDDRMLGTRRLLQLG